MTAKRRRAPAQERHITVQGVLREEPDLQLIAQAMLLIAKERKRSGRPATVPVVANASDPSLVMTDDGQQTVAPNVLSVAAREISAQLLAPLGRRWQHVQAVAAR